MALQWQPETSIRGPQGLQGATGAKGDRGDTGATGSPGAKGDKGDPTFVTTQAGLATALAAGGDVYCDSAVTIALTSTQNITKPTRLIGGRFTRTTGEAFRITSSNVEISGVTITGGGTPYDQSQKLIRAVGSSSNRLTGINIHDCVMRNSRGDNIWLDWTDGASVSGNSIRGFLYSGVMLISATGARISGNDIVDAPLTGSVINVYGIALTDADNTAAARSRECVVVGNRVDKIDWEGIDTHGGDGVAITGNVVTGCPRGIALVGGNTTRVVSPERCVVTGNRVDSLGLRQPLREGITLAGRAGATAEGYITGNHVTGYGGNELFLDYYNRAYTYVGGNMPPLIGWTDLPLASGYIAGTLGAPQYMVDGNVVYLRGSVQKRVGTGKDSYISNALPSAARPSINQYLGALKVASGSSSESGILLMEPNGQLRLVYETGTSTFNWTLSGTYRVP